MSQFTVFDASNAQDVSDWTAIWSKWHNKEVFAHPSYLSLFSSDASRAMCAFYESENGLVLYPFFLRDIPGVDAKSEGFADIVSPYGYGGAFAIETNNRLALSTNFWGEFGSWCVSSRVVSEFVRFSLFDDSLLPFPGEVQEKQENIVRSLDLDIDTLWVDFEHKVRKNVKKAQRSGVVVKADVRGEFFDDFYRIYESTMDRRSASSGYYFDVEFFQRIHRSLAGQFVYFHAWHEGRIISTELVLLSAESAYSFLGGTESDFYDMRPNDLLKYEVMSWAAAQGIKRFVLGGGYVANDGIFRYKKAFAPSGIVPFFVGKRVHDETKYAELVRRRCSDPMQKLVNDTEGFFPAYRA